MSLRKNNPIQASAILKLCKCVERQMWHDSHPLLQMLPILKFEVVDKLKRSKLSLDKIKEMPKDEIGMLIDFNGTIFDSFLLFLRCISFDFSSHYAFERR